MKNGLVVKDNALINASYNLETTEQRLIMLAIMSARDTGQGITADSKLEIHASDYANQFNVTNETAYEVLKSAVNNLFERKFSYIAEYKKTGKTGIVRSRWVSRVFYVDTLAILEITFAPDVVPLITRLEEHFTSYQLKQVSQLTSKYAIRLYELLIAWREVGKTPQIDLAEFRQKIGVEAKEYERMHHFKARVLEPSIKQINEHTDITVTYEQHKKGRAISGFSFRFKQKPQPKKLESKRDPNTADLFTKITDAQRLLFGKKLAHDARVQSDYSHLVGTGSYEEFGKLLAEMLAEEQHFKMFYPLLVEHGFK